MRLSLCMTLAFLTSCAVTPKNEYYELSPVAPQGIASSVSFVRGSVTLVSVHLPEVLDRIKFVERTGPNSVSISEFQRWAEPLDQMVPRVLRDDFSFRSSDNVNRRVSITVDEFMAAADGTAALNGEWHDAAISDGVRLRPTSHFSLVVNVQTLSGAGVAAALSRLLGKLSDQITKSAKE